MPLGMSRSTIKLWSCEEEHALRMRRSEAGLELVVEVRTFGARFNALNGSFSCGSYLILRVMRSCAKSDDNSHHLLRANHGQWVAGLFACVIFFPNW